MSALSDLHGVHIPITTPFERAGGVSASSLDANLRTWLTHPIAGLVIAGSTGEAPLLDRDELLFLVERAADLTNGRSLIVGTGAEATRDVISDTAAAAERGATSVLVRAPSYYRSAMSTDVLYDHFVAVADASSVPVILYHIPKFVPVSLDPDLVARLAEHENIVGIKDSSGDPVNLALLVSAVGSNGSVLVGSGALLLDALDMGAIGGILGVANIATALACEVYAAWRDGAASRARTLQERLGPLHTEIVVGCGIPGVKAALDRLGLVGGPPRSPLRPLAAVQLATVEAVLEAAGLGVAATAS